MEARLPADTLTFLFTDVEGSTRALAEQGAERYADTLREHHGLIRDLVAAHGGIEVDTQGDAFFCVFTSARDAVACAQQAQARLATAAIRVRMGLHSGEALVVDDHYVGMDVHRAARVAAAGRRVPAGADRTALRHRRGIPRPVGQLGPDDAAAVTAAPGVLSR